jgi:hypothetical protein
MRLFFVMRRSGLVIALTSLLAAAPPHERPLIWVRSSDRAEILAKIESQPWARQQFLALKARADAAVSSHRADPSAYLRTLPWIPTTPGAHPTLPRIGDNMASSGRSKLQSSVQTLLGQAIDCGVLYFLTRERAYAACAADGLQAIVRGLRALKPSEDVGNGGWLYVNDHLYEARALGAQVPMIYDFIASYARETGVTVFDLASGGRVPFDFAEAQAVFRTYATLAIEHGMSDTNWPVLEMPSLAHNALALDDPAERARLLAYVTHVDTERQDPLSKIFADFERAGYVWPESIQYSSGVSDRVLYVVSLLRRQTPAIPLPSGFSAVPRSLLRLRDFRFPNGEYVRFGDGPRRSSPPYASLELAYALARREGDEAGVQEFGGILRDATESGRLDRGRLGGPLSGAEVYLAPLALLWQVPEILVPPASRPAPSTTDVLPFAGLVVQRNLAPDGATDDGLMAAVSGAAYVHSHASGMALELYGAGQVLGSGAGKGTYTTDEHENYRRLFAAYNGVIVNGASRSQGRWVNLGIDTVRPIALEPAVGQVPVSPHHSFTLTTFTDRTTGGDSARQERLVGIVRTSERTGYYVDVFRSAVQGGSSVETHDYLYHNIGDGLDLTAGGMALALRPAPDRFQPAPGTAWQRNRSYLFPGWHVFQSVSASATLEQDVCAIFPIDELPGGTGEMRIHLPGFTGRSYATARAPVTKEAPPPYDRKETPVLVVRQQGAAWSSPFAALYEPCRTGANVIQSVRALRPGGPFSGFEVDVRLRDETIRQYVLVGENAEGVVEDAGRGLYFQGRYGVVTLDAFGRPREGYVGEGRELRVAGWRAVATEGKSAAFVVTFRDGMASVGPGGRVVLSRVDGPEPR